MFVAVKNKPAHVSSQIKNLLALLGSGGIQIQVPNKQILYTYHVPDCALFVRDAELNKIGFQPFRKTDL